MPKAGAASLSSSSNMRRPTPEREDSAVWNDDVLEGSDDDEDAQDAAQLHGPLVETWQRFWTPDSKTAAKETDQHSRKHKPMPLRTHGLPSGEGTGTSEAEITDFLTHSPRAIEGHRGLGIVDYGAGE